MKLSIIVPIYNAEEYLSRCIDSVISSKSDDIELLLINDGSSDKSDLICKEYIKKDSRIVLIEQRNLGVSIARNNGIMNSTGEYVMFLDADDYLIEDYYDLIIGDINESHDFIGYTDNILDNNRCTHERYPINEYTEDLDKINEILMGTHMLHTCWGKLFKKNILNDYNVRFPEKIKIGEDYIFVLEYFKYVKKAKLDNRPIVYYCINNASVMRRYNEELRFNTWKRLTATCQKYYSDRQFCFDDVFYRYELKNTTSFLYDLCKNTSFNKAIYYIEKTFEQSEMNMIIDSTNIRVLSAMKKIEYCLMKTKNVLFVATYFKIKSCFEK